MLWFPTVEEVPAATIDAALAEILGPMMEERGFEQVSRRKWVRSAKVPIREVLDLLAMKGYSLIPVWGFSLDFAPHVSGSSVKWHRTPRSALLDLRWDPFDYEPRRVPSYEFSGLHGEAHLRRQIARGDGRALRAADGFWNRVQSVPDLVATMEWVRRLPSDRFVFDNYSQQIIAYAFALAATGAQERAAAELAACITRFQVPPTPAGRLVALLAAATS